MTEELLPAVIVGPSEKPNASVIWLHGLGADGHDFEPIVPELGFSKDERIRFVFPNAPMRPVTINYGKVMRAWYDITALGNARAFERSHLDESKEQVEAWIAHERGLGVEPDRIVLAGFSQGGAIALYAGLQQEEALAGIMALSSYHPTPELIAGAPVKGVPVFIGHGTEDDIVPVALAEKSAEALRENGFDPEWHTYPIFHGVSADEVRDIALWLRSTIGR